MGRKSGVPVGAKFLPGTSANRLGKLSRESNDVKTSRKYLAAMHRKMGKSNGEIAALLGEKYGTVRAWLADMHKGGVASIPRRKSTGAPRKMPLEMRLKIVEAVQTGPRLAGYKGNYWTFKSLWMYAREKLGLKMAYSTAVQNFREMGLAVHIPRASHPLAASAEERAAFQKKEHGRIADSARAGYSALFVDEGHAQAEKNGSAAVGLKGIPTTRPSSVGRARATLFVGVGADFAFIKHAPAANTDEYIKFLDRMNSLVGKIHAIADRASYHESIRSKAHIAGNADRIRVTKTIPYTPNDNAAEPQVRIIKAALANVGLDSVGAILYTLDGAVKEDMVSPVPLYRFARTDGPRIGARRARAIQENELEEGEWFVYKRGATPAPGGKTKLPTAAELKDRHAKGISPKKLENAPRILVEAGVPEKFLANLPDALLHELPSKARHDRELARAGKPASASAGRTRAKPVVLPIRKRSKG